MNLPEKIHKRIYFILDNMNGDKKKLRSQIISIFTSSKRDIEQEIMQKIKPSKVCFYNSHNQPCTRYGNLIENQNCYNLYPFDNNKKISIPKNKKISVEPINKIK